MQEIDRTGVASCRYLMYDNPERTKAWRLDVDNDGKNPQFYVNGHTVLDAYPLTTKLKSV